MPHWTRKFSYSRTRGLFVGISLDGSAIQIDGGANPRYTTGLWPQSPASRSRSHRRRKNCSTRSPATLVPQRLRRPNSLPVPDTDRELRWIIAAST